jgi:hypothetical protein
MVNAEKILQIKCYQRKNSTADFINHTVEIWCGQEDLILVATTQSRDNFGFATLLGQSRL